MSPPGLARAAPHRRWGRPEGRPTPSGHGGASPGLGFAEAWAGRPRDAAAAVPAAAWSRSLAGAPRPEPPAALPAQLPALIMPWPFSESIKKRACRYLLQRYLGHFLQEKLSLEQLSLDLYQGTGSLAQVPLDKWVRGAGGQPGWRERDTASSSGRSEPVSSRTGDVPSLPGGCLAPGRVGLREMCNKCRSVRF